MPGTEWVGFPVQDVLSVLPADVRKGDTVTRLGVAVADAVEVAGGWVRLEFANQFVSFDAASTSTLVVTRPRSAVAA